MLKADGQWGLGATNHWAYLTAVTTISATIFDVIFDPPLPKVGDDDPDLPGKTIPLGHEKALSVYAGMSSRKGRGAFGAPADPRPSWWIEPANIA